MHKQAASLEPSFLRSIRWPKACLLFAVAAALLTPLLACTDEPHGPGDCDQSPAISPLPGLSFHPGRHPRYQDLSPLQSDLSCHAFPRSWLRA